MELHGELLRLSQGFCSLYVSGVEYGRRSPCPAMVSVILQRPLCRHHVEEYGRQNYPSELQRR